jgi:hypothetical protein
MEVHPCLASFWRRYQSLGIDEARILSREASSLDLQGPKTTCRADFICFDRFLAEIHWLAIEDALNYLKAGEMAVGQCADGATYKRFQLPNLNLRNWVSKEFLWHQGCRFG